MSTTGAAAAAPARRAIPVGALGARGAETAPTGTLNALHGAAETAARTTGTRLLESYDHYPPGMIAGSGSDGLPSLVEYSYRPGGVAFSVFDQSSRESQAAWHGYWRQNRTERGGYATQDEAKMAAAPATPTYGVELVVSGTWEQLRDWLTAPQQTSMFDLLGGAA